MPLLGLADGLVVVSPEPAAEVAPAVVSGAGSGAGSGCGSGMPAGWTVVLAADCADGMEQAPSHNGSIKVAAAAVARIPGMNIINAPHFQLMHVPPSQRYGGASVCGIFAE